MKIYVASSWRNQFQPEVVKYLRNDGHQVYDFRGPGDGWGEELTCQDCQTIKRGGIFVNCPKHRGPGGFSWSEIDSEWQSWPSDVERYLRGLNHPRAVEGFQRDMDALQSCDACILVNPCGQSAHAELGWAAGAGKLTAVYCPGIREPDLMVKMADCIADRRDRIESWLESVGSEVCP